jgi:hypothetical protein
MSDEGPNPYEAPAAAAELPPAGRVIDPARAARVRRKCLPYERFFVVVGLANYIGAGLSVVYLVGSVGFVVAMRAAVERFMTPELWALFAAQRFVVLLFAGLHYALGRGLTRLRPWARNAQLVLSVSVVGLFLADRLLFRSVERPLEANLIGLTVVAIQAGVAYVLASRNGARVVTRRYRAVVAATPGVRPRLGWPTLVGVIVLALIADVGILATHQYLTRVLLNLLPPLWGQTE